MADLPFDLDAGLTEQLARVLDVEGKIPRAFEALGPVGGRDVALIDSPDGIRARQLRELGARVMLVPSSGPATFDAPAASADAMVAAWSAFRAGPDHGLAEELAEAERILRPGGRLLVLQDYGRDDVTTLLGDPPGPLAWSKRDGPYLGRGFRVRVIHCFWTFSSLDEAGSFLAAAFGEPGAALGARLIRPRISYNVAIYHRTVGATELESTA